MIESKDLELKTNLTIGTLTTNAGKIRAFVEHQLDNYKPELYIGRADEAKKDRAELNKAADILNEKRKEIEREFNKPFVEFKDTINGAVKTIKAASAQLDAIVKGEESREKDEKRGKIEALWQAQKFDLVPLEKVFNDKWLNKTYKLGTIEDEIKTIISGILEDLEICDNFDKQDVALIKSAYLDTLSIKDATRYAETLKANREKLAAENKTRQQQTINAQLDQQHADERDERNSCEVADLVGQIYNEPTTSLETYALVFSGTRPQLMRMREYMTAQGITYQKLTDNQDGTFSI